MEKKENKKVKNKLKDRIAELQKEMQMHIQRRQQAQQALTNETLQIAAKEGAIQELQNLFKSDKSE